ncbi:hypothetical protein ACQPU1_09630 [Clostridium paraputrificum]|uniref:hypothetical protein n=1 Tax=Clostridium TaxID=1485 RepID=UPI003D34F31D
MNIKRVLSKAIACSIIAATTATLGLSGITAKASEVEEGWKTLVLVCPRAEIQRTPYVNAATTIMYESEVAKVKADAKIMEETINSDSVGRAKMTVEVAVSDMPITNKSLSMAVGPYIGSLDVENILDKYAPEGKYDSVLLVYRNNDYSTSLGTANTVDLPSRGTTNGTIYSTVKLDDADHLMKYPDNIEPMYLIDRFAEGAYQYMKAEGFKLDSPYFAPYNGTDDLYQYNKAKRNFYRWYFFGLSWTIDGEGGITEEMWKHRPTI